MKPLRPAFRFGVLARSILMVGAALAAPVNAANACQCSGVLPSPCNSLSSPGVIFLGTVTSIENRPWREFWSFSKAYSGMSLRNRVAIFRDEVIVNFSVVEATASSSATVIGLKTAHQSIPRQLTSERILALKSKLLRCPMARFPEQSWMAKEGPCQVRRSVCGRRTRLPRWKIRGGGGTTVHTEDSPKVLCRQVNMLWVPIYGRRMKSNVCGGAKMQSRLSGFILGCHVRSTPRLSHWDLRSTGAGFKFAFRRTLNNSSSDGHLTINPHFTH